jgi:hypothetical protein
MVAVNASTACVTVATRESIGRRSVAPAESALR